MSCIIHSTCVYQVCLLWMLIHRIVFKYVNIRAFKTMGLYFKLKNSLPKRLCILWSLQMNKRNVTLTEHNRDNLFSFKITANSVVAFYFYFPITQVFGSTLINMQVRSCWGNSSYFTTFSWIHLHNREPSPA